MADGKKKVRVVRTRTHMYNRVTLTVRFLSVEAALCWLREDVAAFLELPLTPNGWLKDRPNWEVVDKAGKTVLTVDEWGREEEAA